MTHLISEPRSNWSGLWRLHHRVTQQPFNRSSFRLALLTPSISSVSPFIFVSKIFTNPTGFSVKFFFFPSGDFSKWNHVSFDTHPTLSNTIAGLNASGPAHVAMEELISVTVHSLSLLKHSDILRMFLRSCSLSSFQNTLSLTRSCCYQQIHGCSSYNSISRQLLHSRRSRGPHWR